MATYGVYLSLAREPKAQVMQAQTSTLPWMEKISPLAINNRIDDLGLLYKVDLLNYQKQKGTPIGEHIDRVGKVFYSR